MELGDSNGTRSKRKRNQRLRAYANSPVHDSRGNHKDQPPYDEVGREESSESDDEKEPEGE
jgi:hypothetical protein